MIEIRREIAFRDSVNLTVCSHCKERTPTTRLYRLFGVGLRNLCRPCFEALDRLGMNIRPAA